MRAVPGRRRPGCWCSPCRFPRWRWWGRRAASRWWTPPSPSPASWQPSSPSRTWSPGKREVIQNGWSAGIFRCYGTVGMTDRFWTKNTWCSFSSVWYAMIASCDRSAMPYVKFGTTKLGEVCWPPEASASTMDGIPHRKWRSAKPSRLSLALNGSLTNSCAISLL